MGPGMMPVLRNVNSFLGLLFLDTNSPISLLKDVEGHGLILGTLTSPIGAVAQR